MGRVVINQQAVAALKRHPEVLDAIEEKLADPLVEEIKADSPVDSGHLRDSNYAEQGDGYVRVGNTADYATFVDQGTRYQRANPFFSRNISKRRGDVR